MMLKIVQTGDPVLRKVARQMTVEEIKSDATQRLIDQMRHTMRDAPGVGLAAPQIGIALQLAVIEDRSDYLEDIPLERRTQLQRSPVDFHVIINPKLYLVEGPTVEALEGCLSVSGFGAIVRRAESVRVECLNEKAEPITIDGHGWYARILQHEIDHLNGTLYIDRMHTRSFTTMENAELFLSERRIDEMTTEG